MQYIYSCFSDIITNLTRPFFVQMYILRSREEKNSSFVKLQQCFNQKQKRLTTELFMPSQMAFALNRCANCLQKSIICGENGYFKRYCTVTK